MQIDVKPIDLFPTRVWSFDLAALEPHFPAWRAEVDALRANSPTAQGRSNRRGWNSDKLIFEDAVFEPLRATCSAAFAHAFKEMGLSSETRYRLEAWANVHDLDGFNMAHVHHNVMLCASFYLTVPENSGSLTFHDPRPGALLSAFEGPAINNTHNIDVRPRTGALVIFPHWLMHSVEPHNNVEPRVCIAMNALYA